MYYPIFIFTLVCFAQTGLAESEWFKSSVAKAVSCFEKTGHSMPMHFDEEGTCGTDSLWLMPDSKNILIIKYKMLEKSGGSRHYYYHYKGEVIFSHNNSQCKMEVETTFTDEDASVDILDLHCPAPRSS